MTLSMRKESVAADMVLRRKDLVVPLILYGFLVINGCLGINFGRHWDEWFITSYVDDFYNNGPSLPNVYLYPSFCYFLELALAAVFRVFYPLAEGEPSVLVNTLNFTLLVRTVFTFIASLSVFWVCYLTWRVTDQRKAALVAGVIFCSSFEFSYHSRWGVTDLIATQFAILSTAILFNNKSLLSRLLWSSFVAGVAVGTKYTAGIVCLNIALTAIIETRPWGSTQSAKRFILYSVAAALVCFTTFIITTPGSVFKFDKFWNDLQYQRNMYGGFHIISDTLTAGWEHFLQMLSYYVLSLFSPFPIISVMLSLCCIAGAGLALIRREWKVLGLFLVILAYMIFMSRFNVMIVRNILYALPYFTVLAAYGLHVLYGSIATKKYLRGLDVILACMLGISLCWNASAAWSVFRKDTIDIQKEVIDFFKHNDRSKFILSQGVWELLYPPGVTPAPSRVDAPYIIFMMREVSEVHYSKIGFNRYQMFATPWDVNEDYYPNWSGMNRIFIIKTQDANYYMLRDLKIIR